MKGLITKNKPDLMQNNNSKKANSNQYRIHLFTQTAVFFAILFYGFTLYGQKSPDFEWAKSMGGSQSDIGYSIVTDAQGNVYTTGYFEGTADFDPGSGTQNLTSGGGRDVFISKLDNTGKFVWAKKIGGFNTQMGYSIAADVNGSVYVTGYFWGKIDFNPGSSIDYLNSRGDADIFVLKLDSAGNYVWAKGMGGKSDFDAGHAIVTDGQGNLYSTGTFQETAYFGNDSVISVGKKDIYVSKMDTAGNVAWVKGMGGSNDDEAQDMVIDGSGNIYTTGSFIDSADFNPGSSKFMLTSGGNKDIFISKLSSNGNFVWAKSIGGNGDDIGYSITTDKSDNVYITGYFEGTVDFDSDSSKYELTSSGNRDIFICKLDPTGKFVWAKQLGGSDEDIAYSITTDDQDNIYTSGYFNGTADFDPSNQTFNLTSEGDKDAFISKLDKDGNFVWAQKMGSSDEDKVQAITSDNQANIYTTGDFGATADFDPGTGTHNLNSAGDGDIFVQKLSQPCNLFTPLASTNAPICGGRTETLKLNASGGSTYNWSGPNNFSSSKANPTISKPNAVDSGKYSVTISDGTCTSTFDLNVVVHPGPDASFTVNNLSKTKVKLNITPHPGSLYFWDYGDGDTSSVDHSHNHDYGQSGTYTVKLVVTTGSCGADSVKKQINTLGIEEYKNNVSDLSVYPNPFTSEITLKIDLSKQTKASIFVYDNTGRRIYNRTNQRLIQGENILNLQQAFSNASAGIYIIGIKLADDEILMRKVIKTY